MNSKDIKFNDRVYIENKVLRRRLKILYTSNKVFYKFVRTIVISQPYLRNCYVLKNILNLLKKSKSHILRYMT